MSSSSGTSSGAEEELAEKVGAAVASKRAAGSGGPLRSPRQHRQTQTAAGQQQQQGDQQKPLASSLKSSQSGQQAQRGERMVGARFKIKRSSIDLGHRQGGGPRQQIQPTIDEGHSLENSQGSDGGGNGDERIQMMEMKVHPMGGGHKMDRRFSKGGSSLEFPPNIEFYRNTLENEGTPATTRPSMMDLVEGMKQKQQPRRESVFSVEMFRERNVEIMEGQRRVLGKVRNQPRRSESDSSKKSLHVQKQPASAASPSPGDDTKSAMATKFGWFEGVLIRCMASIFGVMLYLRLSWVAGQAGLLMGSCVILLGSFITIITTLSTSAICTNGLVKGGGAYFLISRSLGPEFGGSIGIIFSIANAVGAAMYLVGFAETIRDLLKGHSIYLLDGDINDIRLIALVACALIVVVILVGLSFESKMQIVLMVVLWVSIFDYWIGTFLTPSDEQQRKGITGYRVETVKENLMPQFREGYDFFTVFAVYFPAATGIMAGANISGDLKDPQTAIPLGTMLAIGITTVVYLLMVWMTGSTTLRDADGLNVPQLLVQAANASKGVLLEQFASQSMLLVASNANETTSNASIPMASPSPIVQDVEKLSSSQLYYSPPACLLNQTCQYGLMNYFQIVELGSALGPLVTIGIIASTLSSALVSMVGAPKIFQAVCRDRLFPYINRFARGHGPNDEPRQALFLASLIVVAVILIGNLNMIAPLISNFFLCSYALINYACFDNSFAHSPGFRPSFKFYNMWVSLAGSLMCVFCMFIISWWTALLTFFFFVTIYMYVAHRKPDVNWGSSAQAHSYRNALQYVSKLERTEEHVKNYRPQILVLSGNPAARAGLVDFAYSITKGASLLICGYIVPYKACNTVFMMMQKFNQQLRDWFVSRHLKATFAVTVANPNIRAGTQSLLQIAGLGKLRPNIILMGYKQNWAQPQSGAVGGRQSAEAMAEMNDYFGLIQDAFDLNMSVGVLRNSNKGLDISELILESTEELKQHLRQMDMGSTRSYPLESHPCQQQSIQPLHHHHSPRSPSPTLTAAGPAAVNPRQKARDMLLKAFGQRGEGGQSVRGGGGLTVQSSVGGGGGGETLQTTLGGGGGGSITPSSSSTVLKQRRGLMKGWFSGGAGRDDVERANEEDTQTAAAATLTLPLPSDALRFQTRVKHGTIDVWWLYDDGGLTLLIPYLLTKEKSYLEGAKLRVFTLAGQGKNLQQEQQGLASMLKKFRITADQVNVIPDFTSKRPDPKSLNKFDQLIEPFVHRCSSADRKGSNVTIPLDGEEGGGGGGTSDTEAAEGLVTEAELNAQQDRTWRQLRIAELLRRYSSGSDLIVVTLPVPRRGLISPSLYLAWLEMMSDDLPPTLLLRGNQQSVLTFYS